MISWLIFAGYLMAGLLAARFTVQRFARKLWTKHTDLCNTTFDKRWGHEGQRPCGCFGWKFAAIVVSLASALLWPLLLIGVPAVWFVLGGKGKPLDAAWIEKTERELGIGDGR